MQAHMNGARLAYVVRELQGTVRRKVHSFKKGGVGIVEKYVEEPAGFLVYFPRGHVVRIKDKAQLRHYGLHNAPAIVNLSGLNDPNSPIGKLMMSQDEAIRRQGMANLEDMVIRMAEAKAGKTVITVDAAELEEEAA